jgi:hypothetical protein
MVGTVAQGEGWEWKGSKKGGEGREGKSLEVFGCLEKMVGTASELQPSTLLSLHYLPT